MAWAKSVAMEPLDGIFNAILVKVLVDFVTRFRLNSLYRIITTSSTPICGKRIHMLAPSFPSGY